MNDKALALSTLEALVGRREMAWVVIFAISGTTLINLLLIRNYYVRTLTTRRRMHELAHYLRDCSVMAHQQLSANDPGSRGKLSQTKSNCDTGKGFSDCCDQISNKIATLFKTIAADTSVKVAIRLASYQEGGGENGNGRLVYVTVGRSDGYEPGRKDSTESITADNGLPAFFQKKECKGVVIIDDLEQAIAEQVFEKTRNDEIYPNDFRFLMAGCLNGPAGHPKWLPVGNSGKSNIGLLFICSEKHKFSPLLVDILRSVADLLSIVLPGLRDAYIVNPDAIPPTN